MRGGCARSRLQSADSRGNTRFKSLLFRRFQTAVVSGGTSDVLLFRGASLVFRRSEIALRAMFGAPAESGCSEVRVIFWRFSFWTCDSLRTLSQHAKVCST